jgi:hypothetical protein
MTNTYAVCDRCNQPFQTRPNPFAALLDERIKDAQRYRRAFHTVDKRLQETERELEVLRLERDRLIFENEQLLEELTEAREEVTR